MFEHKNKKHKIARKIIIIVFAIFLVYFVFNYYGINDISKIDNISIAESEMIYNNDKTDDTNVISNVTNCVVGVSKLKNTGDTIFVEGGINQMGLGSRNNSFGKWLYINK